MQGGKDCVPGERGFERDLRRLEVADLADHQHVGVAAQDRAQARGERQSGALVHLQLVDVGQPVLDWILDRDHVDLGPEDVAERGVDRRRLAAAGRAGDEEGSRWAGR